MQATAEIGVRELDHRRNGGIDIRLVWSSRTNRLFVAVEDERQGGSFQFAAEAANALDAFQHPYAYASRVWDACALAA